MPVVNEATNLPQTLASIQPDRALEIIVVDGGSSDRTLEIAHSFGVKVLSAPVANRAVQMNLGALSATGDILLFLHADTRLPKGFDTLIHQALNTPKHHKQVIAGAFALHIDAALLSLRIIERGVNWRSRWLQMPYGDQAIFMKSVTFHQIGGFPQLPIMEDFELMRQLRRQGRIAIISVPAIVSARRWLRLGVWQTTIINQLAIISYLIGVPPQKIARWYYQK
nr:TIGR04283 family arsenosugar biosynthesis glycosyltransferase [Chroococcidiopsis sp. TS-821]